MTREEWIERAARHYHERGGMGITESEVAARALYEGLDEVDQRNQLPEDVVDADMSYWSDEEGGIE